jgi:hypothetical protein
MIETNVQNVNEFLKEFTKELEKWMMDNSLRFYEPMEVRAFPVTDEYKDNAFMIWGSVEHIITMEANAFGISIGERFNKPLPNDHDGLMVMLKELTDPLTEAFWPERTNPLVLH